MSAFLEEYGKIIVVIIVIAALIGLAVLFKNTGKSNAENSFGAKIRTKWIATFSLEKEGSRTKIVDYDVIFDE